MSGWRNVCLNKKHPMQTVLRESEPREGVTPMEQVEQQMEQPRIPQDETQ